jgi:hypothetical protein
MDKITALSPAHSRESRRKPRKKGARSNSLVRLAGASSSSQGDLPNAFQAGVLNSAGGTTKDSIGALSPRPLEAKEEVVGRGKQEAVGKKEQEQRPA